MTDILLLQCWVRDSDINGKNISWPIAEKPHHNEIGEALPTRKSLKTLCFQGLFLSSNKERVQKDSPLASNQEKHRITSYFVHFWTSTFCNGCACSDRPPGCKTLLCQGAHRADLHRGVRRILGATIQSQNQKVAGAMTRREKLTVI